MSKFTKALTLIMVLGALLVAIIFAWKHGVEKGSTWDMRVAFVIGLVVVAIMEYLAWHNAACNWFERRLGAVVMWATVGAALTVGTLYTNFSSGAGNNAAKAGVQLSALTLQQDLGSAIKDAEKKVDRLEQRLKMAPERTAEAAQAAIDNAKAHRFWQATNGCTETKGKQTREFCDKYASAVADQSLATRAMVDREELALARTERDGLYAERKAKGVVVNEEDQPQVAMLHRVAQVDMTTARQVDAMALPFLMQIVILFGGLAMAAETYRHRPRVPWIDVDRWLQRIAMLRSGWAGVTQHEPVAPVAALVVEPDQTKAAPVIMQHRTVTDRAFARTAANALSQFRGKTDEAFA